MLQESGYSQDTSTSELLSGFTCRFLGGSGLTAEEDKPPLLSCQTLEPGFRLLILDG